MIPPAVTRLRRGAAWRLEPPLGTPQSRYILLGLSLCVAALTYWVACSILWPCLAFSSKGKGSPPSRFGETDDHT